MRFVGYFTAEIGLWSKLHTYSGGLGVLAGDHVKSAADAGLPLVAMTILYRKGYGKQSLDSEGVQSETYPEIDPTEYLFDTKINVSKSPYKFIHSMTFWCPIIFVFTLS